MLSRILTVALIAGVIAGVSVSTAQFLWTVPLISEAETYEDAARSASAVVHTHDDVGAAQPHDQGDAWAPGSYLERSVWTVITNMILGVGAGLLLTGAFALRRTEATWVTGLAWGGAAFLAVGAAPALGLPPELPGAASADLAARQLWWAGTAASTIAGLAVFAYARPVALKAAGVLLLTIPHLIGAPQPATYAALAPPDLRSAFVVASLATTAMFWIVLGGLVGMFANRFLLTQRTGERATSKTRST